MVVQLIVALPDAELAPRPPLGLDVGIAARATFSDGTRYMGNQVDHERLTVLQQRLSAAQKGAKTRQKRQRMLAKEWQRVRGARTPGNPAARKPGPQRAHALFDKLVADTGYISAALTKELLMTLGGHVLPPLNRQMKPRRLLGTDKLWPQRLLPSTQETCPSPSRLPHLPPCLTRTQVNLRAIRIDC